ncbi:hypothetical protein CKM354_000922200 [Cercospora kikuchii]|uniref:Zn(2)-C6 fungal-type domain-containing protein n=1 Tax=Cercospora kikuchii TaxID=84275 RepID=A0A9P3FG03_9PEZI|nr:uncharacterized protein CKM354_000922200 [Cercospora kikuchii]GIZ46083.1 hypothetical protein CKM354_000922200 [Cercospora kikuchii]
MDGSQYSKPRDVAAGPSKHARPAHHDALAAKRSRPCDACRRRKSKCVTEDGSSICVLCRFHGQACTYIEAPQPRKRNIQAQAQALSATASTVSTASQVPLKRKRTLHLKPGTGVEEYDTLPGSLLTCTLGLQNRHHSEYVGLNAVPDVYSSHAVDSTATTSDGKQKQDYIRFVHPSHAFRIIPDEQTEGYEQERTVVDEIEALANGHGKKLVELFFRVVHPSFPIIHKDVYLEKYARSYREFSPPLLAAVYLLASSYWAYDEQLARCRMIDTAALQALAFSSLQNTMRRPKLSTIQAGLLLSQWQKAFMGASNDNRDRLTVQLVNIAHGLGLHLDCSHWELPDWEIGLRRRIGWALFIQDKWTSLLESRPSLISMDDWEVEDLSEMDFPENVEDDQEGSGEVERGRLVFTYMAHLSVVLGEILRSIFSARARRMLGGAADPLAVLLEWMKPLQISLKDWFVTLPETLKMDTAASMKLSSVGYLRLAYLTVEVCLHKKLLRTLNETARPDPTIAQVCRAAATERFSNGTDFVQRLQAQHLHSFWYFPSAKCCALIHALGQTLSFTSFSDDERGLYERKLKEYKWNLKVNSEAGASFMKQALALINQSVRVVSQAGDGSSATTSPTPALYVPGHDSRTPEQPPPKHQWIPHHPQPVPNGGMVYDSYHDYSIHHDAFSDPNTVFAPFPTEMEGAWIHDLR